MSFEEDMIEAGFQNENDYLNYLYDKKNKKVKKLQDYYNEDDGELEYKRELHDEKVARRKELKSIYNQFVDWRINFPHEVHIWEGDSRNTEIVSEYSPKLKIWQKWKIDREKEDKLIEEAKPQLNIVKKLVEIDAISWGFNQFLHERKIDSLIKIISKWKKDNSNFIDEYNSFSIRVWSEYGSFQQRAIEEYKKIIVRCLPFSNSAKNESFLGRNITIEDVQHFLEMRHKNFSNRSETYDYIFHLDDIRKLELWVKSNHFVDWDNWARLNMNWETYVRNGYAHMYQEVWWQKHKNAKNYWECEDSAIPEGYNYNPEFKRRLIVNKLKSLSYSGGKVFNDHLAVIEEHEEYGFIDTDGNVIIDVQFDEAREFHNELAAVKVSAKEFDIYIPELDDYITSKYGGQWGFINTKGTFIIQPQYEILSPFKNGIAVYCKGATLKEFRDTYIPNGGKWGIITQEGKELIPPTYDFIKLLEDGVFIANIGGFRNAIDGVFLNGLWCVLSKDGNELTPFKYTWIFNYENGRAIVNVGGIREEFDGATNYLNGEWGYIDEKGYEIEPLRKHFNIDEFKKDWRSSH